MLGRVVITSVPRGLDGGAGFQAVLRTQGLQPSIAERLAARAAYPHPFPFGDPRNPHVVFHRIERVGDRTIHILGSVRDAGASYTGRSNHLAELIALDPAETRSLPGGPAFAARSFPWLGRWTGEPRAVPLADEVVIPAYDPDAPETTRRPAHCPAWEVATGDAGWAGELAQSFLDGRRALIWAGDPVDVLELFTEALRLLPASVRWQVTFNTCEIEPFPAHWRAVRPELGLVGNYEPTNELRLVLGKIRESRSRAPDHDLSRLARGEAPVRDTRSAPSVDRGHESLTQQDDIALRARLREISETRRRRTGPAVSARPANTATVTLKKFLSVGALVVGAVTFCVYVLLTGNPSSPQPSLEGLRSAPEESERAARFAEEKKQAKVREAEQAKAVALAQGEAKRAKPEPPRPVLPKAELPKAEPAKREQVATESTRRNNYETAVKGLKPDEKPNVSLFSPGSSSLDVTEPKWSVELSRTFTFDFDDLNSPHLELATPYASGTSTYQLKFKPLPDSTVHPSHMTGKILGTITGTTPNKTSEVTTELGKSNTVQIVARDQKLFLDFSVGSRHQLITMLSNSVLVITTEHPENSSDKTRKAIEFFIPRSPDATRSLEDELTFSIFKSETEKFSGKLVTRTEGIPSENFAWELTCSPQSGPSFVVTTGTTVKFPPDGPVLIEYKDLDKDGKLCSRQVSIRVTGTLSFRPEKVEVSYDPSPSLEVSGASRFCEVFSSTDCLSDPKLLKTKFQKKLAGLRNEVYDKLLTTFVNDERKNAGQSSSEPFSSVIEEIQDLTRRIEQPIKVPGQNYSRQGRAGMETYSDDPQYKKDLEQLDADKKRLDGLLAKKKDFENSPDWKDADRQLHASKEKALERFTMIVSESGPFGPMKVRLTRLTAIAHDSQNREYRIPMVDPPPARERAAD